MKRKLPLISMILLFLNRIFQICFQYSLKRILFSSSFALVLIVAFVYSSFLTTPAFAKAIGLRMGWNYANVNKTNQADQEIATEKHGGFYIAGTGENPLSSVFFFHGEIGFIQRGYSQTSGSTETRYRGNYFLLAPLLKAKMFSSTKLVPEFGPFFGFKTSERVESQTGSTTTVSQRKEFGFFDFGLAFGLGVEIPLGGAAFTTGLRYHLGIKDIDQYETTETKTRGLLLFVGASFPF